MITQTQVLHSVSFGKIRSSAVVVLPQTQPLKSIQRDVCTHSYEIQHTCESEATLLLFAVNPTDNQGIVIKILKEYQDLRFQMKSIAERRQCQLEALVQNRRYSSDIYYGLARVYRTYQKKQYIGNGIIEKKIVELGEIIENPQERNLDEDAEYALVMRWLPKSRRLDYLLTMKPSAFLLRHMELLGETIAKTHEVETQMMLSTVKPRWGSPRQLQEKLHHNLPFLDRVLEVAKAGQLSEYDHLKSTFAQIKAVMSQALRLKEFRSYFKKRVEQQKILHCHGDLKAANIWILAAEGHHGEVVGERVKILDAIDFNAAYCNIDILADMAMLAVDLEVKKSQEVAQHFINHYLKVTQQENAVARTVLTYYLVEKAMIGIIVSYMYDKQPELGLAYVRVAQRHMAHLRQYEHLLWRKSLAKEMLHHVEVGAKRGVEAISRFRRAWPADSDPQLETTSTSSASAICLERTIQDG